MNNPHFTHICIIHFIDLKVPSYSFIDFPLIFFLFYIFFISLPNFILFSYLYFGVNIPFLLSLRWKLRSLIWNFSSFSFFFSHGSLVVKIFILPLKLFWDFTGKQLNYLETVCSFWDLLVRLEQFPTAKAKLFQVLSVSHDLESF